MHDKILYVTFQQSCYPSWYEGWLALQTQCPGCLGALPTAAQHPPKAVAALRREEPPVRQPQGAAGTPEQDLHITWGIKAAA